jgi:hypothetical protein
MNSRAVLALLTSAVIVLIVLVVLAFAQPTTVSLEDGVQATNSPYRGLARAVPRQESDTSWRVRTGVLTVAEGSVR